MKLIHARTTPDGLLFRLWTTVADGYCCEPMERPAFVAWMRARGASTEDVAEERFVRAIEMGTSAMWTSAESLTEWDTEVCGRCGGFHHAYAPRPDESCARCGNPKNDRPHGPACEGP